MLQLPSIWRFLHGGEPEKRRRGNASRIKSGRTALDEGSGPRECTQHSNCTIDGSLGTTSTGSFPRLASQAEPNGISSLNTAWSRVGERLVIGSQNQVIGSK